MFNVGTQLSPLWQQLEALNKNLGIMIAKSNANSWWSRKICSLTYMEISNPHGAGTVIAQIFCLDKLGVTFKVLHPQATNLTEGQVVFLSDRGNTFCFKTLSDTEYAKYKGEDE